MQNKLYHTLGLRGFTVGISVPSALCRLESNVFLFLAEVFWQMGPCFFYKQKKNKRRIYNLVLKT